MKKYYYLFTSYNKTHELWKFENNQANFFKYNDFFDDLSFDLKPLDTQDDFLKCGYVEIPEEVFQYHLNMCFNSIRRQLGL